MTSNPTSDLGEDRFKQLIQMLPLPLAYVSQGERFEFINDRFTRLFGYTLSDIPDLEGWWRLAYPDELYRNAVRYNWANLIRVASRTGSDIESNIYTLTCKNGEQKIVKISGITLGDDFLATFIDVTERITTENALRESEERLSFSLRAARLGTWDYYVKDNILICDSSFYQMLDYDISQLTINMQTLLEMIHPDDRERVRASFQRFVENHTSSYDLEYRIMDGHDMYKWMHSRGDAMERDPNGKPRRITGVQIDIHMRKQALDTLEATLEEKEILLKEIHHRVKNNMQTISSLLYKQRQHLEDTHLQEVLDDSINRVKAMALIHEQIYRSASLAKINFADFIQEFSQRLYQTYRQSASKIQLDIQTSDFNMPIDKSIPCALILNELITNCLKYAFPDDRPGKICIISKELDGIVTLIVEDDGVGFQSGYDVSQTKSLGLYLVYNIAVRQLRAKLDVNLANPTRFEITFSK